MGKASRTKGKSAELEVVQLLRQVFPDAARDLEQTRGHDNGRDIIGTEPWCIQVKRRAKMTREVVLTGLREAARAGDGNPVCIHRGDREPWKATSYVSVKGKLWPYEMLFSDWLEMVAEVVAAAREVSDD